MSENAVKRSDPQKPQGLLGTWRRGGGGEGERGGGGGGEEGNYTPIATLSPPE